MRILALLALLFGAAACRDKALGQDLTALEVEEALKGGDVQLIDVRSKGEWDSGRIKGAKFIPITEFKGRLAEIDKNKPVITYCAGGGRSLMALEILKAEGYSQVSHLAQGIDGWKEAGKAVEK